MDRVDAAPGWMKVTAVACLIGLVVFVCLILNNRPKQEPVREKDDVSTAVAETPKTVANPFPWSEAPAELIARKTFENQEVLLDGKTYTDCTFIHVTFVYNGTSVVSFIHNSLQGPIVVRSDNPAVKGTFGLMKGFGALKDDQNLSLDPGSFIEPIGFEKPTPPPGMK